MYNPTVFGVDPGQVHTGLIMLDFRVLSRELVVDHRVIDGLDSVTTRGEIAIMASHKLYPTLDIFIEKYRPRSGFTQNQDMMQANTDFSRDLQGKLLSNSGVKKVVTTEQLKMLHVWHFSTTTHHQDLRSAARIAVLGMMQTPALNKVLFEFITDNIDGRTWNVTVK